MSVSAHVSPFQVYNGVPMEAKVEVAVSWLRVNMLWGKTHLQAEHFNMCLREAYLATEVTPPPPKPYKWIKVVDLVKFIWYQREFP